MKDMKKNRVEIVRTSISMTTRLWCGAMARMEERGYATFSDYVAHLIREDGALTDRPKKAGAA